jgi:hypothetical protein
MPRADRGSVWIVDLGLVGKVRPCLVLSVPTDPQDRVLVTLVPHTTSMQGTRFEVAAQAPFLHGGGEAVAAKPPPYPTNFSFMGGYNDKGLHPPRTCGHHWHGCVDRALNRPSSGKAYPPAEGTPPTTGHDAGHPA